MSVRGHHRIARQVLDLELVSIPGAPRIQEEVARPFRDGGPPGVEDLFDRLAGPDEVLRLDRLDLDLGELRGADWRERFFDRLLDRLRASLEEAAARRPREEAPGVGVPRRAGEIPFQRLLFFLSSGRLPWWGGRPEPGWLDAAPRLVDGERRRALAALLRREPGARERLVHAATDRWLAAAVEALGGPGRADRAIRLLAPRRGEGEPAPSWRRRFWRALLEHTLELPGAAASGPALVERLLAGRRAFEMEAAAGSRGELRTAHRPAGSGPALDLGTAAGAPREPSARRAAPASSDGGEPPALPAPWGEWLESLPESDRETDRTPAAGSAAETRPGAAPEGPPRRSDAPAAGTAAPPTEPGSSRDLPPAPDETGTRRPPRPSDEERGPAETAAHQGEAVYLAGAGAVILHPFLEELFASRGLLEDRAFRDEPARFRAVHLLGHLTYGADDAPEYDLLLPKLLCAMPWEDPLPPPELDDADRGACADLLAAVLGHWQSLKSSSSAWLREGFLLREGKLEPVDRGWRLTVERRAQDVLLDRLPWGLGLVRLPWMTELLHVSWT